MDSFGAHAGGERDSTANLGQGEIPSRPSYGHIKVDQKTFPVLASMSNVSCKDKIRLISPDDFFHYPGAIATPCQTISLAKLSQSTQYPSVV